MNNTAPEPDEVPKDLDRILALPKRQVLDCERERGSRRWSPQAQALIEVMTAKFTRGQRLSCGCQARQVQALNGGEILISKAGRPGELPPIPLQTTVEAFCRDNAHDAATVKIVRELRPWHKNVELPGLGHSFCATELNPVQAWMLRELAQVQGIFGMVSVGGGKTWCGILAPLAVTGCRTVIILAKPDQRLHYRNHYLRLREHFRVPSIVFDGGDLQGSFIVPGTPVLHFVPYSQLSNSKSTDLLERLNPDMVVADECHLLANRTSSRTMRFLRFMAKRGDVKFLAWSGSLVHKSLKDASHLAAHALGLGSPYPIDPEEVDAWSAVMDPSPMPDMRSDTANSLRRAFGAPISANTFVGFTSSESIRTGFRERVIETPGVVSTRSSSVSASITISMRKAPKIPDKVQAALTAVRTAWLRPDGEELVEIVEQIRCAKEVASGFFNRWIYPKGEPVELIEDWFAKRKAYNKELRAKLMHGEAHLDSPMLCFNAAERAHRVPRYDGPLPVWPSDTWPAWAEIKDQVEPDSRAVWLDTYLAEDAAEWAKTHRGIVWCQSTAFGNKVAELAGLPYHGGGIDAEKNILAEDGSRSIIASQKAHGESRDGLQLKFCEQLIAEVPSSAKAYQQIFGRLVREGQQADTVETWIYMHVSENRDALRKAIAQAEFVEATTPNRQLLLAADINFTP